MKKQGMEITSAAIWLIIFVISAAILLWFLFSTGKSTANIGTIDGTKSWVAAQSKVYQMGTGKEFVTRKTLGIAERPPTPQLQEPLEITKKEQLAVLTEAPSEAIREIGDSMVDCWNAFGRGELPFKAESKDVFCYSCRAVWIDEKLRQENVGRFKTALASEPIDPFQDTTYIEYMSNVFENYGLLLPESLSLQQDLFIYFIAFYEPEKIEEMITFVKIQETNQPLAQLMTEAAEKEAYYPFVLIGDARMIDTICNEEKQEEEKVA